MAHRNSTSDFIWCLKTIHLIKGCPPIDLNKEIDAGSQEAAFISTVLWHLSESFTSAPPYWDEALLPTQALVDRLEQILNPQSEHSPITQYQKTAPLDLDGLFDAETSFEMKGQALIKLVERLQEQPLSLQFSLNSTKTSESNQLIRDLLELITQRFNLQYAAALIATLSVTNLQSLLFKKAQEQMELITKSGSEPPPTYKDLSASEKREVLVYLHLAFLHTVLKFRESEYMNFLTYLKSPSGIL